MKNIDDGEQYPPEDYCVVCGETIDDHTTTHDFQPCRSGNALADSIERNMRLRERIAELECRLVESAEHGMKERAELRKRIAELEAHVKPITFPHD